MLTIDGTILVSQAYSMAGADCPNHEVTYAPLCICTLPFHLLPTLCRVRVPDVLPAHHRRSGAEQARYRRNFRPEPVPRMDHDRLDYRVGLGTEAGCASHDAVT